MSRWETPAEFCRLVHRGRMMPFLRGRSGSVLMLITRGRCAVLARRGF